MIRKNTLIEAVVFDLFGTLLYIKEETKPYLSLFADLEFSDAMEVKQARRICLTEDLPDLAAVAKRLRPNMTIDTSSYDERCSFGPFRFKRLFTSHKNFERTPPIFLSLPVHVLELSQKLGISGYFCAEAHGPLKTNIN